MLLCFTLSFCKKCKRWCWWLWEEPTQVSEVPLSHQGASPAGSSLRLQVPLPTPSIPFCRKRSLWFSEIRGLQAHTGTALLKLKLASLFSDVTTEQGDRHAKFLKLLWKETRTEGDPGSASAHGWIFVQRVRVRFS